MTRQPRGQYAGGIRALGREHRQLAVVGAGALLVTLFIAALEPSPAQAWILGLPSPGQVISGLLGGIGNVIGGTVGKLAVTAFDAIVHALFAPIAHFINAQLPALHVGRRVRIRRSDFDALIERGQTVPPPAQDNSTARAFWEGEFHPTPTPGPGKGE